MRNSPPGATPMSADVPPTSSVITLGWPTCRPTSMPAISAPTGPDSSSEAGRLRASATGTMPPADVIKFRSAPKPSSVSADASRSR